MTEALVIIVVIMSFCKDDNSIQLAHRGCLLRKMKRANLTTYDVLVANLNKTLQSDALEKKVSKQFTQYGETKGVFVKENNQGKYVVVRYLSEPDADRAVSEANGLLLDGQPILVKRMERRLNKPPGAGGGSGVVVTGGTWVSTKDKSQFGKNPDIVPIVEPIGSSSPGPEGEPAPLPTSSFNIRGHLAPMNMYVTHVETPTLFWCQELQESVQTAFKELEEKLASVCPAGPKVIGRAENSKVYGAQFSEDGLWYRCQVKANFSIEKVKVQYIDYGNCEEVSVKDLVELPVDMAAFKPFADKVMMHNTRFLPNKDKEAIKYLKEAVGENQRIVVHPTFRLPDGTGLFAQLYVDDINLNQGLIDNGFAVTKPPKQQMQQPPLGDQMSGPSFHIGDGGGYIPPMSRGLGGKPGGRPLIGEPDMRMGGSRFGGPNRGPDPNQMGSPMTNQMGPNFSDLKIELQNKNRMIEKTSMDLSAAHAKMKSLQQEFQILSVKMEENNVGTQLKTAANLTDKVRRLRSQFSDDKPTAVDEAIQLASSADKLTENSVTSLAPLMTTLTEYRTMQQEICQAQTKEEISTEKLEERDATRKTLFEQLTACITEMEGLPFTERAKSITECCEKLMQHYDNFFNIPAESSSDFKTIVAQYEEFKANKQKEFEETRLQTDQQQEQLESQLSSIGKKLSLSADAAAMECDLDLSSRLKQYCAAMQQEIAAKSVEGSTEAHFISALVQAVHRDLKAEILCVNNYIRLETEFRSMKSGMEEWLEKAPTVDKLLETRQTLRSLKSKLRHKLADKHDAEENEDKEMMEEVQKDVANIQLEIHDALIAEEKELAALAMLVDSHFPEFLALHPDCGLDVQLKYKGLLKASHEVNHYNLTPVPGSKARLFFSKFAGQDIIIMECLLSDGHHMGRDDFLAQLMAYTSMSHPSLLHPSAVFFDKNNRHGYFRFDRGRGEILANHIEYGKPDPEHNHIIVKSVCEALAALHSKKVLHGEINPYSILHHPDGTASLLPPDLSCRSADRARNKYTSPNGYEFMAPEMLALPAGVEPTGVVDMYCVGILIVYLTYPRDPASINPDGSPDLLKIRLEPPALSLVKSLTSHVHHLRPTAEMVLQSQYVLNSKEDKSTSFMQQAQGGFSAEQDVSAAATQLSALTSVQCVPVAVPATCGSAMPGFSMPNTQQPPPPLPSSYPSDPPFSAQPSSDTFSSLSMDPNGFGARNPSPFATPSSGGGSLYESSSSGFGSAPSGFDSMPSGFDTTPSGFDTTQSGFDTTPSGFNTTPSGFDSAPSGFDSAPSGFDSAPSGFNTTPSGFNTVPSGFDTTPSGFDSAPSGFDSAPSGFDSAPTGFEPTPSGLDPTPSGFEPAPSGHESSPGGFEEAALQQEQHEKESRGHIGQFSSAQESGLAMGGQGEFEIGTFCIDDVNGAASSEKDGKGRKITRQPSEEKEGGGDKGGDGEWEEQDDD
ncbi:serine/threonine-protein kinase 31-like isoform X2 [Littorina saxatilis]|uniref:serine/threonine-protein kinase 31-like isoform X2 n=1 Tax=Littorina saxatilis TaxID=31220 RepID=UPI0038B5FF63